MADTQAVGIQTDQLVTTRDTCRLCKGKTLTKVWSFGTTPLANSYLDPEQVGQPELMAPLDVYYCHDCSLVQLLDVVHPDALFKHYLYVSSTSPTFVKHFEDYAATLIKQFKLTEKDLVVDVGSNDGVLLKPLQHAGIKVLGVDPAENVAAAANADGIPTVAEYFTPAVAEKIRSEHGKASIITANNVFAHTDDIDTFVEAVGELLQPTGVFVFEVQYLGDLLTQNLFDIVYHEHVNYYGAAPLAQYFGQHDMEVFDIERVPVHGGSLRVYVQFDGGTHKRSARMKELLQEEMDRHMDSLRPYEAFAQRIEQNKHALRTLLDDIKAQGKRVVGYGAPAKATTLMYAFGLTGDDIEYIVDDAPLKQGKVMPGTHIPIKTPETLYSDKPDYCLVLAWNFAEPIMQNHARFAEQGGKFIVPIPEPRVV